MCLIIFSKNGEKIPREKLEIAFENNPHGAGIMWVDDGLVKNFKGLWPIDDFIDVIENEVKGPYALHLRLKTRGDAGIKNVHPFRVSEHVWMMHNGTLDFINTPGVQSDSLKFAKELREMFDELDDHLLFEPFYINYLQERLGRQRFVFANNDGEWSIVGEKLGVWENDIWYSNEHALVYGFIDNEFERRMRFEEYVNGWIS